ncbi:MAG: hypothetical protein KAW45_02560, partial [Thermoplasmatales archaeon]|nr:hypothetical protein [Thermoplasmatales archaeon]
ELPHFGHLHKYFLSVLTMFLIVDYFISTLRNRINCTRLSKPITKVMPPSNWYPLAMSPIPPKVKKPATAPRT